MITLDRILVSTEWEHKYPLCFAWSKTRVGSDHWLIFLDTGENLIRDRNLFYFEKQWLLEDNFNYIFSRNWQSVTNRFGEQSYSLDLWHGCLSLTRQYLRGCNANKESASKKKRKRS
jgi:hypothetical protein